MQNQVKSPAQGPQVTTSNHLAQYNLLAAFGSMAEAREVIEALGRAGVDGQRITLQGEAADEAGTAEATPSDSADADAQLMEQWSSTVVIAGLFGGLLGALGGAPIGAIVLAVIGSSVSVGNIMLAALLSALFVGAVSALIASMYRVQAGETWELSFHRTFADQSVVGVHSANPGDIERARQVFLEYDGRILRDAWAQPQPRAFRGRPRRIA